MMIELLGSLICFLSGPLMEDIPSLAIRPRLSLGLDSILSVSLVSLKSSKFQTEIVLSNFYLLSGDGRV